MINKLLKRPLEIIGVLVGIIGGVVVPYHITFHGNGIPKYSIQQPEILVKINPTEMPDLKLSWTNRYTSRTTEIRNALTRDILIWNDGNEKKFGEIILDSDPITVVYPHNTFILNSFISKTYDKGGSDLGIKTKIDTNKHEIIITVPPKVQLEKSNGFVLKVTYTEKNPYTSGEWTVKGIVGAYSLEYSDWSRSTNRVTGHRFNILLFSISAILLLGLYTAISGMKKITCPNTKNVHVLSRIGIGTVTIAIIVILYYTGMFEPLYTGVTLSEWGTLKN